MRGVAGALLLGGLGSAAPAGATPGPDSVAILANADMPGSVVLAANYGDARDIPLNQRCALPLPPGPDITLDTFQTALAAPLRTCLDAGGVRDRIEAVVLMRGVPMRVVVPTPGGEVRVSLAAALGLWDSAVLATGAPILGQAPGRLVDCGGGNMCLGAAWRNVYSGGRFRPGWALDSGAVHAAPMLVTALFGRSDEDAARLITSGVQGDADGGEPGEILLMDGADPARGALDGEYDVVLAGLQARGFLNARRTPFDADSTGLRLAALATGTDHLGQTIEGNVWRPGSLVDNLTSFGAVAENFAPAGESQVSIARFVAMGVAGVHGTTDEPLNNCFPSRRFLLDSADGATLAEAFHSNLPFAYWHNLVLGDPMSAPYAVRPTVTGLETLESGVAALEIGDPAGRGAPDVTIYVDGVSVFQGGGSARLCTRPTPEGHDWLVVAQAQDDGSPGAFWRPKGWAAATANAVYTPCALDGDARPARFPDLASDAAPGPVDSAVDAAAPDLDGSIDAATPDTALPDAATPIPDAIAQVPDMTTESPPDGALGAAVVHHDAGGGCTLAPGRSAPPPTAVVLAALGLVALRRRQSAVASKAETTMCSESTRRSIPGRVPKFWAER